ncbi:alanyl-tRNA editing protein [Maritalea mediterranea]|uniref:Alanine--tRNA ligase n=1 Tax=Maritalea mediterranea TaxID=2909667 RepID=A0ABS9E5V7_9HYPH|nr:alanyl-tRNA editing protein [Maritalea mediterranea]MCF4098254.1 alanyl-tRNA editing protein [Maritalea mediterranea]
MTQTEFLFRNDAYLTTAAATISSVGEDGGIFLDRSNFYATSGGQPGDSGFLERENGDKIAIVTCVHPDGDKGRCMLVPEAADHGLSAGEQVTAHIDWDNRYKLMRMHTALHLLSVVIPLPVTGGSIGVAKSRLDFQMPEPPEDKDALADQLNALIERNLDVQEEWISEEELEANPDLVKTMSVKPPSGQGKIRMIRIVDGDETIDWQPCGGTHVANTQEIGMMRLGKVEKKGKQNRRVAIHFADE